MSAGFKPFIPLSDLKLIGPIERSQGRPVRLAETRTAFPIYRRVFKRLLDIAVVLLAAPFVVPIIALMGLLITRDGGSVFYTQFRVGRNGRIFRMWKLRTMVDNADARLETYLVANPDKRREWDETQKLANDPRITAFGKFLRSSSIDELPQLWNVLIGDMSLVGPRPMMVNQQSLYPSQGYYALRPGVTGYWQTAGRNKTTFAARAVFDDAYLAELSLRTDLTILVRTVGVVLKGTGS